MYSTRSGARKGHMDKLFPNAAELVDEDSVAEHFYKLEDRWERKMWHQLTELLDDLFTDVRMGPLYIPIYEKFVFPIRRQLNTLSVAFFAVTASHRLRMPQDSLDFLDQAAGYITFEQDAYAYVLIKVREAQLYLRKTDLARAKNLLELCRGHVESLPILDKGVLGQFYNVCAEFYAAQDDFKNLYHSTLQFLGCFQELRMLPQSLVLARAETAGVAALLSSEVYDFTDLMLHPVFRALHTKDMLWLVELVKAVNFGEVQRYQKAKPEILQAAPDKVKEALPFIEQKICLMALVECVFRMQSEERTIAFTRIARETHLQPGAKVEILIMKAFSLGLMAGSIDEISRTVNVEWVQPRTLSPQQILTMRRRVAQWDADVSRLGRFMRSSGGDVWQAA